MVSATRGRKRCFTICGLWMTRSVQLLPTMQMPLHAYIGHDLQSDREAAWALAPGCLDMDAWDSVAVTLFQHLGLVLVLLSAITAMRKQQNPRYLVSCVSGNWLSAVFTPPQLLENGLTGFFWLLLEVMAARQAGGSNWQNQFLARATVRNSLFCCANMIEWVCRYPNSDGSLAFAPTKNTEQVVEYWFGQVKRAVGHNVPSLKAFVLAAERLHWSQKHRGLQLPSKTVTWSGQNLSAGEVSQIATRALAAATTLRAVAAVQDSPDAVSAALEAWFEEEGSAMFFAGCTPDMADNNVDPFAEEASEEEDENDKVASTQAGSIQHGIRMLEREAVIEQSLLEDMQSPPKPEQAAAATETTTEAVVAETLAPAEPATLWQMLVACGFHTYKPAADGTPEAAVERLRKLQPLMVALLEKVRTSEGFLSENAVLGDRNPRRLNAFQDMQAQLAQARRAWGLAGRRTSRADAWRSYAGLVADKVQEVAPEAASVVDVYRPSFILSQSARNSIDCDSGTRDYQFIVVREHVLGEPMVCLVEEVFRLSMRRDKKVPGSKPFPAALPQDFCGGVHVRVMEPFQEGVFKTTLLHKRMTLECHSLDCSAPQILYQIPASQCRAGADPYKLVLKLTSAAVKALKAAEGLDFKMEATEDAREEGMIYTADMFGPSAKGALAIKSYMREMKKMYEKTSGQPLADAQGRVTAMRSSSFPVPGVWDEIVQRCPLYFELLLSTKDLHGKSVAANAKDYSMRIYRIFQETAPTKLRGTQAFLTFLRKLNDKAPAALPTA
ncbi:unnamed protein product [Symbiodinium sp. CCMP2592]|nr:unnamed protein product [Symbiodinium sp. CCMP2592]